MFRRRDFFFITQLAHNNVPLPVIQTAVGHSSLRSTSAYIEDVQNSDAPFKNNRQSIRIGRGIRLLLTNIGKTFKYFWLRF